MIRVYLLETELRAAPAVSALARRQLLRLASRELGVPETSLVIKKESHGKPYFRDFPKLQFSISHTRGRIALALSEEPVGIDIELLQPHNEELADRFFTAKERDYVCTAGNAEKAELRFLEIWTRKEAYAKYTGEGLSRGLRTVDTLEQAERFRTLCPEGYVLSLCAEQPEFTLMT